METKLKINNYKDRAAWDNGIPIGNGRLGAMIPGVPGIDTELIPLNEDSIWYGPARDRSNPIAKENVPKVRQLLAEGKVEEANRLAYMSMTSIPKYFGAYEPMGELYIFPKYQKEVTDYDRTLDMETGIATVSYTVDGVKVFREHFVSYPDNVIVLRFHANAPKLDFHTHIMRRPCDLGCDVNDEPIIRMHGQAGPNGVEFDCLLSAKTDGDMVRLGDFLSFQNATEVVLYITANTTFYEKDPLQKSYDQMHAALAMDYEELKQRHVRDFSALFHRASVDFGTSSDVPFIDRLNEFRANGTDAKGLLELLFNYGRYLTISASRPGSQAMNLQGIWNPIFAAPWECNYTVNINTEMNYWIANSTGLSECHEPLFSLIERMIPYGEITAKRIYGCDGFVSHHTTNLWGDTSIEGTSSPCYIWPTGGAWLLLHMWDHYLYTQDKDFLKSRAFPLMKKSALFFTQYMTKAEDGCYVTGPSLSPENMYLTEDGQRGKECMAPEIDNQIVRALFHAVTKAYEILDCKDAEYETYCHFLANLRPSRTNSWGGIMEWDKDYKEFQPGHRHLSPLFGLYPDSQISPEKTPEIAKACEVTLQRRHDNNAHYQNGFGFWTAVWAACCYARLNDGEKAIQCLYEYMKNTDHSISALQRAPVYQIEGNIGAAAAVYEMLLTSNEESITLLPALPKEIDHGSFTGLCTRGNFVIDAQWSECKLCKATVRSNSGLPCRIKATGLSSVNTDCHWDGDYLVFGTEKGCVYELRFY